MLINVYLKYQYRNTYVCVFNKNPFQIELIQDDIFLIVAPTVINKAEQSNFLIRMF